MPYKDPEAKRRNSAAYREARRAELAAKQRAYHRATRTERHASAIRYLQDHPHVRKAIQIANGANARARSWSSDMTKLFASDILTRWPLMELGTCSYCPEPAALLDHAVPISRGGPNTLENLVPTCDSCNRRKAHRTPEEFRAGIRVSRPRRAS